MIPIRQSGIPLVIGLACLWLLMALPAISQQIEEDQFFPREDFVQINPTLPNNKLNFDDDSQESCCAKDYTPAGQAISGLISPNQKDAANTSSQNSKQNLAKSEFERSNPRYLENSTPAFLVSCERFAELPQTASNTNTNMEFVSWDHRNTLPITSYSTNVSIRNGAAYATDPAMHNTSDFHIETSGGNSVLRLVDVHSYSVCMGRGNNVTMAANTDNASILTYNGEDRVYLAGNNTNMLTRTGAGEDLIELHQAKLNPAKSISGNDAWTAFNIYKTALSGGSDTDTLVIKGSPVGTKWCHIGGYRIFGEYFYVVEFALPPSVQDGPRRQRVNIGQSVEFVVIKGKKYRLNDFLVHGQPVDTVAHSVPIDAPLPRVSIN